MSSRSEYRFPFSRYPALRLALLLVAGILLEYRYSIGLIWSTFIFLLLLFFYLLAEWQNSRTTGLPLARLSTLLFLMLVLAFGSLRMSFRTEAAGSPATQLLQVSPWEEIDMSGQVLSTSKTKTGKERWDIHADSIGFGKFKVKGSFKARVLVQDEKGKATLGDTVRFSGTIIPISEKRNPHDFDYKKYLASQGIQVQVRIDSLAAVRENRKLASWFWWRERALGLVEYNFDKQTAPIAKALLLGYKQDLDPESKTAFARAGLSHIMAVSGLHVGFIVAPFWIIIPYFWTRKYGSWTGLGVLIFLLISYCGITGFSASVLRASVMAGFLTYGKLFHKVNDSINLTAAAAVVLLIANPAQLFEIGFQLSFSAVFIILLILPVIQTALPYWLRIQWYGKPLMIVIVSMVVQFGLYPLQVYYFGEVSLVSPLANALFVPLLGIVVPLSLLAVFIAAVMPLVGFVVNYPSLLFLKVMAGFVHQASGWEWAWTTASLSNSFLFVFWLFLVLFIASFRISALRWKMLIGLLVCGSILLTNRLLVKLEPPKLEVTFLDVGQGDAAFLRTPSGKHILIDAGIWSPGYSSGKSVIIPHLKESGVDTLDAVILSHPHADHIGGILDLIREVPLKVIYNSGYEYDSKLYDNYLDLAADKGIPVVSVKSGDVLHLDPSMLFLVYGPDGNIYNDDPNEHSIVIGAFYGQAEFLFTGDAGEEQEARLVHRYGELLDVDLLKVGHHGSRTSSGTQFLQQLTPEIAVVSLSERNRFRHPHPEAVQRLFETDAEVYFTSRDKALVFESDGTAIERIVWD